MFQDRKVKRLLRSAGAKGFTVFIYLLSCIYRDEGYYYEWDEHSAFDISDELNFSENAVKESVKACCSIGLFNEDLFSAQSVLTSESIQKRWKRIVTDAKRVDTEIDKRYLIINGVSEFLREETEKPPEEKAKPAEETPQSKVKQRKVNKPSTHPREQDDGPEHKPDSLQEVITFFANNGAEKQLAEDFYDHYESQGWVKSNGMAIVSWHSSASKWIRKERNNPPSWKKKNSKNGNSYGTDRKSKGDKHAEALTEILS